MPWDEVSFFSVVSIIFDDFMKVLCAFNSLNAPTLTLQSSALRNGLLP